MSCSSMRQSQSLKKQLLWTAATNRPNYSKCCKIYFNTVSPKIAFTVTQSSVTHRCPLERSFQNPFMNCSWLLKQFHHEVSIMITTAKHNFFLSKITLVLGESFVTDLALMLVCI